VQILERAERDRLFRRLECRVPRHENDGHIEVVSSYHAEEIHAAHSGHHDVAEDHVERRLHNRLERFGRIARHRDFETGGSENTVESPTERELVIDDQHGLLTSRGSHRRCDRQRVTPRFEDLGQPPTFVGLHPCHITDGRRRG